MSTTIDGSLNGDVADRIQANTVVAQIVNFQTGVVATGTTILPHDGTIPQITEGDEYMTLAITPKDNNNKLRIEVFSISGCSASTRIQTAALFQDSTVSALAATAGSTDTANRPVLLGLSHYMTAGTTSEITFRVRIGANSASTVTFNGTGGTSGLGGVAGSSMTITEYFS